MRLDDLRWLTEAIAMSRQCAPSATAFSVGAIIVDATGNAIATGYSREVEPADHAEEVALARLAGRAAPLSSATLYSSLEPCSTRASRPRSCTDLILATGIPRAVFAWREPDVFADCTGAETLRAAGRTVLHAPELARFVQEVNDHLLHGDTQRI